MRTSNQNPRWIGSIHSHRRGTILVITAIVLTSLVALLGLVIDVGQLMTTYRQSQNAADAAAMAAGMDLMSGKSNSIATATANTFVKQYNAMPTATVTVGIPPATGPHQGDSHFAEVTVNYPVSTRFIQVMGVNSSQSVTVRAVGGYEGVTSGEGVVSLDPSARPGLSVGGGGSLKVNGGIIVNSEGGGVDQNGNPINNGGTGYAASTSNNSTLMAKDMQVVGGVNTPNNFDNYDPAVTQSPLHTGQTVEPDPLVYLPTPTTANGAVATNRGSTSISGNQNVTLLPGVYSSISITGGTTTFSPGIYILTGGNSNSLKITGGTVTGSGVMFYNTGSDFNVISGLPDSNDLATQPPAAGGASFGGIDISTNVNFTPYANSTSPFNGMLFYQRRLNTQPAKISGNAGAGVLAGTIYAKWANLSITGQGTYNAQFITGSMSVSGTGSVTINYAGQNLGKGYAVFLVE